jgi:hypothetical protein
MHNIIQINKKKKTRFGFNVKIKLVIEEKNWSKIKKKKT